MPTCSRCGSNRVVKNGLIHNGKQTHKCRSCGRQFVLDPQMKRIAPETWEVIDKLLLERLPLAGIARVCARLGAMAADVCEREVRLGAATGGVGWQKTGPLILQCDGGVELCRLQRLRAMDPDRSQVRKTGAWSAWSAWPWEPGTRAERGRCGSRCLPHTARAPSAIPTSGGHTRSWSLC